MLGGVLWTARGFHLHFTHHRHLHTTYHTHNLHRYILIEGKTEMAVRQAKRELQRILDEETLRVGAAGGGARFGRYSVV